MSIHVTDFKWEKGKNDLEYIALLEKNLDITLDNFRRCSKVAREQYNKGYEQGRTDREKEICNFLKELSDGNDVNEKLLKLIKEQSDGTR